MSESAYDISYLLEAELVKFSAPAPRPEKPLSASSVAEPDAASTQAATAQELLNIDSAHEALIQQYMQFNGE
jgi:hypothetical protein